MLTDSCSLMWNGVFHLGWFSIPVAVFGEMSGHE
jgi:hypothetical protein